MSYRKGGCFVGVSVALWIHSSFAQVGTSTVVVRNAEHRHIERIYFGPNGGAQSATRKTTNAKQMIRAFAQELGYANPKRQLRLEETITTLSGTRYVYRQYLSELPVYRGEVILSINLQDQALSITNNGFVALEEPDVPEPTLTEEEAIEAAKSFLFQTENLWIRAVVEKREIYVKDRQAYPTYRVVLVPEGLSHDWRVWIDLRNGQLVDVEDMVIDREAKSDATEEFLSPAWEESEVRGGDAINRSAHPRGRVFDPDPKSALRLDSLDNQNGEDHPVFESAYKIRPLLGLDPVDPLTGTFRVWGQFARSIDWDFPRVDVAKERDSLNFMYRRNDPRFEEVNIYYHVDRAQRYIQFLGFDGVNSASIQKLPIEYDAHGADGQDNSFYVPSLNRMSFGDGGVDDGEDPDIILHEYGHAIQRGINRDWGGGDQRAMGEGFGDYWATALNRSRSPGFHPNWVFVWDGHNQYWPGRVLDANKKYPEDVTSSVHATGMIWSQALAEIRQAIGNSEVADKIVLEHHFGLGGRATMQDAARELIMADVAIFGGAHVPKIVPVLNQRGLLR